MSFAGTVTLIKFVLYVVSLYYLSVFKMPKFVSKEIVCIQIDFLWGWDQQGRKINWISHFNS